VQESVSEIPSLCTKNVPGVTGESCTDAIETHVKAHQRRHQQQQQEPGTLAGLPCTKPSSTDHLQPIELSLRSDPPSS